MKRNALMLMTAALPSLAACSQTNERTDRQALAATPVAPRPPPRIVSPGEPVPNTRVSIPGQVQAGGRLLGTVPVGSTVEVFGNIVRALPDGTLDVTAPAEPGVYRLRVLRPNTTALSLRINVTP